MDADFLWLHCKITTKILQKYEALICICICWAINSFLVSVVVALLWLLAEQSHTLKYSFCKLESEASIGDPTEISLLLDYSIILIRFLKKKTVFVSIKKQK